MKLRQPRAAVVGVVVTGVVLATTLPAQAATTYTPSGSTVTLAKTAGLSNISIQLIEPDQTFTCSAFTLGGSVANSGVSRAYGADAAWLSTLSTSSCSNVIFGSVSISRVGTWGFAITGDASGGVFPARWTNVTARVDAANCKFTIAGVVDGTFDPATQKFTPAQGASGLVIDDIPAPSPGSTQSLCTTLDFWEGDTVEVGGSWTNTGAPLGVLNP